jgi:hypothetical protein
MLREVAMEPSNNMPESKLQRPFWMLYLMIIGIDTVVVFIGSLILGNLRQMSNLYFWSTLVFFIVAAIPIFTELGTSARIVGKSIKDGEQVGSQIKEKQPAFDRGARITYLFGLAGITTFILAILTLVIG